nr:hypothetical protein CFP56_60616 [Quercus suber]
MAESSVDAIISQAAKLSWLKSKVNLEVVSTSRDNPSVYSLSEENSLKIGSMAGRALETDFVGIGVGIWRNNVRVRVAMDTSCPLVLGFPLERNQLLDLWVPFKYEKLGNFCFGCGLLGHDQKGCRDSGTQRIIRDGVSFGFFGRWLHADNDEFQSGMILESLLDPDSAGCGGYRYEETRDGDSVPSDPPNWIQSAMDS